MFQSHDRVGREGGVGYGGITIILGSHEGEFAVRMVLHYNNYLRIMVHINLDAGARRTCREKGHITCLRCV